MFGSPEIIVSTDGKIIKNIEVLRGSPCGATWDAAKKVEGLDIDYALTRFGLEVQFFCSADPGSWDPIYDHSPVHMAADVHSAALKKSLKK
jgi:hypothetical protein